MPACGGACFPLRWRELLVGRPLRNVHTVRVDRFSYPTRTRSRCLPVPVWAVHDPLRRFLLQITMGRVTSTTPHLAKAIGLLYFYLVSLMVILRVSYGKRLSGKRLSGKVAIRETSVNQLRAYPRIGSGRSITKQTLTPVACGAIRYVNSRLNERTGDMLIKTSCAQLPFPFFPLHSYLPPPFPSSFISTSPPSHC